MHIAGIIIAVGIFIIIVIASRASKKQREQFMAWAVPRAEQIARHQGWVSPHRLITQAHMTKTDAQAALLEACARGVLYQAVNGRYYIKT